MVISLAEAFLFDLDGTLVDSSALHARSFEAALAQHAPALLSHFDYADLLGLSTEEALERLGLGSEDVLAVSHTKRLAYRTLVAERALKPLAGAFELLEALRRQPGRRLAIVTSGSRGSAQAALSATGLDGYFDLTVFAEDVRHTKPAPEPYALACTLLEVAPDAAVAVEDSISGVTAAHAAGCSVVGVHNEELRAEVDVYFSTLQEFADATSDEQVVRS